MVIISSWFDGILNIKKGDRIKIIRGIVDQDSVRASTIENITTGERRRSSIEGVVMTREPKNIEPPVTGRVQSSEIRDSATHFKLSEGIVVKRKKFSESIKRAELLSADNQCRVCKNKLIIGGYDFDHEDGNPVNNAAENCRVKCKNCHGIKTMKSNNKGKSEYFEKI